MDDSARRRRGKTRDISELSHEEQLQYARGIVTRQLAMMDRSRAQLAAALARRGVPDAVAEQVVRQFEEAGLVDDAHFAAAIARTRFSEKQLSRRAIAAELRRKGVADEFVEAAVAQITPDEEAAAAITLAEKKLRSESGDWEGVVRRVYGLLARRGFSASQSSHAIREASKRIDESEKADTGVIDDLD
ncbi:MAG: recombination regulator RecX [Ancrocorticia sp.]|jgi:regulatory protein|nr:recombination regulator RecX [Ancrocorticia sp.]